MLPNDPRADNVWKLLEESYLDRAAKHARDEYARLAETDKRTALMGFANKQALTSKRWAGIVQDLRSAGLGG